MLVFTTRLPLKSEITEQDCLNLFVEWVKGSPHYHMESLCFNVDSHEDYEYTDGDVTFSVKYYKDEAIELAACRLHNRERNLTWDSDCIFLDSKGKKTLLVQLNCHWADLRTDFPEVHKPYIIKMFIEKGYCSFDGNIPVTDTPIIAEESNYETFRDIMCGKLCYEMPVVYISKGYWGETAVSETYLARELSGVAHVFVEKNYDIAARLQTDTAGKNVYLGYVGIYFPGAQYCQRYGLEYYKNSRKEMCDAIKEDVWDALKNRADSTQYNWNQILTLQARQKMLEEKSISEQNRAELKQYVDTLNDKKKELADKVEELNKKMLSLRAERDGLLAARGTTSRNGLFYNVGEETELYLGERNDLLYSILSQVLSKYESDTRPYCIIRSLLDANPKVGNCEKIMNEIKAVFRSGEKMTKATKCRLEELGFTIEEGGPHYKIIFKDPRYMFTVSKTPSDHRGAKNLISTICRALDVEKKI